MLLPIEIINILLFFSSLNHLACYYYTCCILWNKKLSFLSTVFDTYFLGLVLIKVDLLWLDNLTPAEFEKYAGKETCRWKNNIWIFVDGYKVPLIKTALLKYYNQSSKHARKSPKFFHRDEFIKCTDCGKGRRFFRHSKKERRSYNDVMVNANFKCSDIPFGKYVSFSCLIS